MKNQNKSLDPDHHNVWHESAERQEDQERVGLENTTNTVLMVLFGLVVACIGGLFYFLLMGFLETTEICRRRQNRGKWQQDSHQCPREGEEAQPAQQQHRRRHHHHHRHHWHTPHPLWRRTHDIHALASMPHMTRGHYGHGAVPIGHTESNGKLSQNFDNTNIGQSTKTKMPDIPIHRDTEECEPDSLGPSSSLAGSSVPIRKSLLKLIRKKQSHRELSEGEANVCHTAMFPGSKKETLLFSQKENYGFQKHRNSGDIPTTGVPATNCEVTTSPGYKGIGLINESRSSNCTPQE